MKVAFFSESTADEAAIRILAEALLGKSIQPVDSPALRFRQGWTLILKSVPVVLRDLHFNTDAEALIVVVDADHTPMHTIAHEQVGFAAKCRVCKLIQSIAETQKKIERKPRSDANLLALKTAIGLAVPAIEAWYLCGKKDTKKDTADITEAGLTQRKNAGTVDLKRELKRRVYGSDTAPLTVMTERAVEEATRLALSLAHLEQCFQNGFGKLARDIRGW